MKARVYLIFNARGFVRAAKGGHRYHEVLPTLAPGERAVRLEVQVPDSAFRPQGVIPATVTVPEGALIEPKVTVTEPAPSGES